MDDVGVNLQRSVFFHGTTVENARSILEQGFRVWFEDPEYGRWPSGGNLGDGIYLSCRWATALWRGPVLLRVTLRPGTRVLDTSIQPNPKTLRYLRREFGKQILNEPPWIALPRNKRLTGAELVEVFRHHYWKVWKMLSWNRADWGARFKLLAQYRSILIRYGYHAYGHPADGNGVVVFEGSRVEIQELVGVLPEWTPRDYYNPPFQNLEAFRRAAHTDLWRLQEHHSPGYKVAP